MSCGFTPGTLRVPGLRRRCTTAWREPTGTPAESTSPAATSPGLGEFSGGDPICMHAEKWQNSFKMVIINEKSLIYNVMKLNVKISHRQPFFYFTDHSEFSELPTALSFRYSHKCGISQCIGRPWGGGGVCGLLGTHAPSWFNIFHFHVAFLDPPLQCIFHLNHLVNSKSDLNL